MPESPYSPRLRTAVVFCGAGTAGAYQAGVLRALAEAGVKVDLLAAHGVGVLAALFGAIDGGSRLWNPAGPWASTQLRRSYTWRPALRWGALGLAAAGILIVSPVLVLVFAVAIYALSLLAGLVSLTGVSARLIEAFRASTTALFDPPVIPTILPRLVVLACIIVLATVTVAAVRAWRAERSRRRWRGAFWWRLVGSPLDVAEPETALVEALWQLVRGASTAPRPDSAEIGRRYADILVDNFGQPGFRELLIAVHDLDGRRDLVGTVLPPDLRAAFAARRGAAGPREAEIVDLSGPQRDLIVDVLVGALRLPIASTPHVVDFSAQSYWQGESHRLCDRPELSARLIEEIAVAGIEQVLLVSAAPPSAVPHGLRTKPLALRGRMGELLQSVETSAFQDAWGAAATRFSGVFVIRPDHNPIGPFDFGGAYDESSDRQRPLAELLQQGYHDAYHQFIEPVVAAGEKVEVI